ncbi:MULTISPECIES: TVP38/TMEM64 family protein [Salegentibacter]|uniref:TVP38/TMEM64 family protein n=1 Tax=Salegentibacter TaxID=143222 RepID=UPI00187B1EC6|nr:MULTISPECIES: TVP38/TMEM64 family protein [Salegentibacter]MBE7638759.1 TVP38/TMEM64 family protein [Salegentibacter sp. BLCTC]MBI6117744.1 TVP38/TMEM64 family protein [Salegentibacter maritimus]
MADSIETTSVKKSKAPLIVSGTIIIALVAAYFFIPGVKDFFSEAWSVLTSNDEERITNWVSEFGWLGPTVLILAMVAQMFLIVIPSVALMVVSILAYGPIFGSLIIFAAIFSASSVGYFIGRYFGPVIVKKLIGPKNENKIEDFIEDYGFWAVIVTRINPFLSNDAISFVGGILKMGYWRFIGATLVGIAPLTIFIAIIGKSTSGLKTGLLWGSIVSLIIFILYVWWDKNKRGNKN